MLGLQIGFLPLVLLLTVIAPFWGYFFFSFFSWTIYKTGKWLGGQAPYTHLRAAFAWSNVPALINVFVWLILLGIHGANIFKGVIIYPAYDHIGVIIMMALFAVQMVLAIWGLVLYFNALAEVQFFSIARAIVNVILGGLFFVVITTAIALAFTWFCSTYCGLYLNTGDINLLSLLVG
jgi:hypothetical protein